MLLATATPVQIHPIEAWDLLYILSQGNEFVLGDYLSRWQQERNKGLNLVTGREELNSDYEKWDWLRNPFPPGDEKPSTFGVLRKQVNLQNDKFTISGSELNNFTPQQKAIVNKIFSEDFLKNHNPFIRHIIRRERKFLETTINPDTNQPYLKPINVILYGEGDDEGLPLSTHLFDAYSLAEQFSQLLGQRVKSSGFIKTMLLRRVCSSMYAGLSTAIGILKNWVKETDEEEEDYTEDNEENNNINSHDSPFKNLTTEEINCLDSLVRLLEEYQERDPKHDLLKRILTESHIQEPWINRGCIVFSQYFDTIKWHCDRFAKISQTSLLVYMPVVTNQVSMRTVSTIANQKKISKRWFAQGR